MIKVEFYQKSNKIVGFEIKNHGKDIVCSAVSILSLNTVNSIE
ncbi:MAG: ribosomal-processing cysteine protease Prp, partial [Eubacteriales bacterium]|nr:ribosomal-processing cysteine protease Prp [Eubacteriales bacterium]